jgi:hypothetical protein
MALVSYWERHCIGRQIRHDGDELYIGSDRNHCIAHGISVWRGHFGTYGITQTFLCMAHGTVSPPVLRFAQSLADLASAGLESYL